jgi:hypothetical protein
VSENRYVPPLSGVEVRIQDLQNMSDNARTLRSEERTMEPSNDHAVFVFDGTQDPESGLGWIPPNIPNDDPANAPAEAADSTVTQVEAVSYV